MRKDTESKGGVPNSRIQGRGVVKSLEDFGMWDDCKRLYVFFLVYFQAKGAPREGQVHTPTPYAPSNVLAPRHPYETLQVLLRTPRSFPGHYKFDARLKNEKTLCAL